MSIPFISSKFTLHISAAIYTNSFIEKRGRANKHLSKYSIQKDKTHSEGWQALERRNYHHLYWSLSGWRDEANFEETDCHAEAANDEAGAK